ncbi:Hypothetical protein HVR_LOCUS409 [uncultured virus]|nr:Hypothetical protein HVR_LOCUS409 [uncultured virus]
MTEHSIIVSNLDSLKETSTVLTQNSTPLVKISKYFKDTAGNLERSVKSIISIRDEYIDLVRKVSNLSNELLMFSTDLKISVNILYLANPSIRWRLLTPALDKLIINRQKLDIILLNTITLIDDLENFKLKLIPTTRWSTAPSTAESKIPMNEIRESKSVISDKFNFIGNNMVNISISMQLMTHSLFVLIIVISSLLNPEQNQDETRQFITEVTNKISNSLNLLDDIDTVKEFQLRDGAQLHPQRNRRFQTNMNILTNYIIDGKYSNDEFNEIIQSSMTEINNAYKILSYRH